MDQIAKLDEQLSSLFASFDATAQGLSMIDICDLREEPIISQQSYAGIYRIDVSTEGTRLSASDWIEDLHSEWEDEKSLKKFTPSFKKKRIAQHPELSDWMPF